MLKKSEMLPIILDHFKIIKLFFFVFKPDSSNLDYSTQPWPIELSASFKPTTTFLVVIQAQTSKHFFMKILCIFIQTRFWHNLIECLFWSQYQTQHRYYYIHKSKMYLVNHSFCFQQYRMLKKLAWLTHIIVFCGTNNEWVT